MRVVLAYAKLLIFSFCNAFRMNNSFSPGSDSRDEAMEDEEVYGVGRFLWEIVKIGVLALVIIIPVRMLLFQPFFVQGPSMEPNFHDGEYLIVGELGYKDTSIALGGWNLLEIKPFRELHRGDPVVFRPPDVPNQFYIKRVIGLPGETVELKNSRVIIRNDVSPSGFILDEGTYLRSSVVTTGEGTLTLGPDEYFFLGDNRPSSRDSRSFGVVKSNRIIGKVLVRVWPFGRAQIF